jgi:phage terminase Nu1 subunit (DNA packaging protein)
MTWTIDRVTLAECARRLGTSHQALGKSLRRAQVRTGDDGKYDFAAVQTAYEQGKAMDNANPIGDRLDGITRKVQAEAALLELKLRQTEGELVEAAAVESAWARVAGMVKGELLSIGNLAPRLAMQTENKIRAILTQAGHDMARHLAKQPEPQKDE